MAWSQADLLALGNAMDSADPSFGFLPIGSSGDPDEGVNDVANKDAMNLVRESIAIERQDVPADEVSRVLNRIEWNAATLADRQWIQVQLATGLIDAREGSEQRAGFLGIYPSTPAAITRPKLNALLTKPGSFLQLLFQDGTISESQQFTNSTPGQIRAARGA